jgi:hypothetical protein
MLRSFLSLVLPCLLLSLLANRNLIGQPPQNDSGDTLAAGQSAYSELVRADLPVAYWRFEDGEGNGELGTAPLKLQQVTGDVKFLQAGPRNQKFPLFEAGNQAVSFTKPGSLRYDDPGEKSSFDFAAGDSITLEAWIHPTKIATGQQVYVIGKGRTGHKAFAADNHNWSLRLVGKERGCHISFLFREEQNRKGEQNDYHRWTSEAGFAAGSGWHYVAVTYQFGRGDSIVGYIDGRATKGTWDMGGKSDAAPVIDNDQVWIGTGNGGGSGNSFIGSIDEVAIYRAALPAERIAARWKAIQPQAYVRNVKVAEREVLVEVLEGVPDAWSWDFIAPKPSERFTQRELAFVELPKKYNSHGVIDDRSGAFVLWAHANVELPEGKQRLLVRSRNSARLFINDKLTVETPFMSAATDGHNPYKPVVSEISPRIRPLQPGDSEVVKEVELSAGKHRLRLEVFVGGKKHRPEVGETSVSIAPAGSDDFWVLGFSETNTSGGVTVFPLTDAGWLSWERDCREEMLAINQRRRAEASSEYAKYWRKRHEWVREQVRKSESLPHDSIDGYIDAKLAAEKIVATARVDDLGFVRRIYLDVIGVTPTAEQATMFANDTRPNKRSRLIDELLKQPGWADNWVGYWQDVLAENPNIVNPTLNNTGPFRWWIYEALLDNKPLDRFATELILMEGSTRYGGTAGFAIASENDAPLAAKAQNIGLAFLAFDMRCARCHDAPSHNFSQEDLFNLAAMLHRGDQTLPKTSTIPGDDASHASLLVKVTLKPGQKIAAKWPFGEELPGDLQRDWLQSASDAREELALRITSPQNPRFAKVMVNRIWQRYMGRGIVEPVDDWETAQPSHPELLDWLSRELMQNGYDAKHISRLIFNSAAYQREPTADIEKVRAFAAPMRRRMTAEQVLDSLLLAAGKEAHTEEMTVDSVGSRLENSSINLGLPRRAWQFTTMGNERDRPSLSLPAAQLAVTLLETFGWRATRQDPLTYREKEPTVLQPAILANGVVAKRIAQLSEDSEFVTMALAAETPADFVDVAFGQILSRKPTAAERDLFVELIGDDFSSRKTGATPGPIPGWPARDGVSWSNHLSTEANQVRVARQREFEKGDAPTTRLKSEWRERAEDMVWTLINSPEYVWIP